MFTCDCCMYWQHREPNLMGVCTIGPVNAEGPVAPAASMNVGIEFAIEWQGSTATAPTTSCENWDSGFEDGDFAEGEPEDDE